jgi:hypothetical protein
MADCAMKILSAGNETDGISKKYLSSLERPRIFKKIKNII